MATFADVAFGALEGAVIGALWALLTCGNVLEEALWSGALGMVLGPFAGAVGIGLRYAGGRLLGGAGGWFARRTEGLIHWSRGLSTRLREWLPRLRRGRAAPRPTATQLRNSPGTATGGRQLPAVNGPWLREGVGGYVPPSVANRLRGQHFRDWKHFREEFWKAVAADSQLAGQFSRANQSRMANGLAPVAPRNLQHGGQIEYQIHHIEAIERGGAVYDLDNLIILAPRTHMGIHNPQVFVPTYTP